MLCFTGQLLLFVVMKGLKMSNSKGDYKNSSPECHKELGTTFYFHLTKKKIFKGSLKIVGTTAKTLLCSMIIYEIL